MQVNVKSTGVMMHDCVYVHECQFQVFHLLVLITEQCVCPLDLKK